jgi:hypothetical protein
MSATQLRNLQTFAKLCGPQAMPNAVIATTMWDEVWEATGVDREQELRAQFWNGMLANGCRLERFQNTCESAWDIIGQHSSTTLRLPDEMVDAGKLLHQTEAWGINEGLPKWIVDLKSRDPYAVSMVLHERSLDWNLNDAKCRRGKMKIPRTHAEEL